jgi:hypothetical protein
MGAWSLLRRRCAYYSGCRDMGQKLMVLSQRIERQIKEIEDKTEKVKTNVGFHITTVPKALH